jgi:hypothetical protein
MNSKHDRNSWDDYLKVHQRRIEDFGHFIVEDRLTFTRTQSQVLWEGELLCRGAIEIHVHKRQLVENRGGRPWVRTVDYSYQVLTRRDGAPLQLFRYDNAAHHAQPDPHHRHRFDANGREIMPPEHVGEAGWPTLGDVLEEAHVAWGAR